MISGQEVIIHEASVDDVDLLCEWWANPALMQSVGFPNGVQTNKTRLRNTLIEQNLLKSFQRKSCRYIVIDKESLNPIGELCFHDMDLLNKSCEIGIKICDLSYQGKGFGYDALKTFLIFLFYEFDLNRIELTTLLENKRAQGLYQKIGFHEVGVKRQCWRDEQGEYHDVVVMDILKHEIKKLV